MDGHGDGNMGQMSNVAIQLGITCIMYGLGYPVRIPSTEIIMVK